jgi:hypothetical protein
MNTDDELKQRHKDLSDRRKKLEEELKDIDRKIKSVCESRAHREYGVRIGSIVHCHRRGGDFEVWDFQWFHNLQRPPSLIVVAPGGTNTGNLVCDSYDVVRT